MYRHGRTSGIRAHRLIHTVLVLALLSSISSLAWAQPDWKELPFDPKAQPKIAFTKLLDGREKMDEEAFDSPLMNYILPQMTLAEHIPEDAKKTLADLRRSFFTRFVNYTRNNPEGLKRLNSKTLEFFKPVIISKDFHPAVRCNAVLLIGQLNDKIAAGNVPTTPSRDGLKVLLVCVRHPAIPDFLKVNALVGLKRHALNSKNMNIDDRDNLMATMLALLTQSDPPKDRDPEAHVWMRRRAAEVLAEVGRPGRNNQVTRGILTVLGDKNSPLSLRCTTAETLGKLSADAQFDTAAVSKTLASLALNVCLTERDLVEAHGELNARRQLVYRLSLIETGLNAPLAKDPKQAIAAPVSQQLKDMIEKYKNTTLTVESLRGELGTHCSQLQAAISKSDQTATKATTAKAPAAKANTNSKPTRALDAFE